MVINKLCDCGQVTKLSLCLSFLICKMKGWLNNSSKIKIWFCVTKSLQHSLTRFRYYTFNFMMKLMECTEGNHWYNWRNIPNKLKLSNYELDPLLYVELLKCYRDQFYLKLGNLRKGCLCWSLLLVRKPSGPSVVQGPTSPGNLLRMQTLRPKPRLT